MATAPPAPRTSAFQSDESSAGSNPAVLIGKTSTVHKANYVPGP